MSTVVFMRPVSILIPAVNQEDYNWERISGRPPAQDRKSTRLNSSHLVISYAVFWLKKNHVAPLMVDIVWDVFDFAQFEDSPLRSHWNNWVTQAIVCVAAGDVFLNRKTRNSFAACAA